MNWLAHVFLSESGVEVRLGNLLADIVKGTDREGMSPEFLRGVRAHQAIDAFTDSHPVVRRSRARVDSSQRRFSGVLVDVFYDHLLATNWERYSATPLAGFTSAFYADVTAHPIALPEPARTALARIVRHDLLGSYVRIEGVERSLQRLSARLAARWNRPFRLEDGVTALRADHGGFEADFIEFFPQLQAHVATLS